MMRFIRIRRPGTGDYTAERHQWLDKLDRKTILEGIQEADVLLLCGGDKSSQTRDIERAKNYWLEYKETRQ